MICNSEKLHEANNELQKKRAIIEDLEPRCNNSCEFTDVHSISFLCKVFHVLRL